MIEKNIILTQANHALTQSAFLIYLVSDGLRLNWEWGSQLIIEWETLKFNKDQSNLLKQRVKTFDDFKIIKVGHVLKILWSMAYYDIFF